MFDAHVVWTVAAGFACLACAMAALWALHLRTGNAAIVDAGWAAGLAFLAIWYAWRLGASMRGWLVAVLVVIWGVRLAGYLMRTRVIGQPEDARYRELRDQWRTHLPARFFLLFEAQAVLDVALSLPILAAVRHAGAPGAIEFTAAGFWAVALVGESLADRQLAAFRRDPASGGRVCDVGLWRYSRHPNYFFEWLVWVAYALYGSASPFGWTGWSAPALMLFFLFRVTGIPATEAHALRSR